MKHNLFNSNKIKIDQSKISGRGVFAKEAMRPAEIIEQCHFIIPDAEYGGKDKNLLRYMFSFFSKDQEQKVQKARTKLDLAKLLAFNEDFKERAADFIELGYNELSGLMSQAVVLGHGMIYNHSQEPNVGFQFNEKCFCFDYFTLTDINKDEELFINYGNTDLREDIT